ncbi:protein translocase subunit SecF [Acuticoccus sp. M5D2P5]|uniref:protein translocase subunit SecF n=1 Tax=Acuticoccus kalidii TaxID=2910977 RepID=UPI001F3423D1|nr:protein translocase subunit SecF [Acuticoccus kalidii]MCF3933061.1 protein translocase subunit SecF [Acuticoccus kalidii]
MKLLSLPEQTRIPFMRYRKPVMIGSLILSILSIVLFGTIGMNYGIDFRGGTMVELRFEEPVDIAEMRSEIGSLNLGDVQIVEFGDPTDVMIRIEEQPGGEEAQQRGVIMLREIYGETADFRRVEVVGPRVSGELAQAGAIAVVGALLAIMAYIWLRFEWHFAVGAVVTTAHDVILTIGLFSITQIEFNLTSIAAVLTIVGYSLNDTVVVYDRVRENLRRYKRLPMPDLIDLSINQMLSRTLMTSITTLLALIALFVFGGEVIRSFTFAMIWGVLVGTFSSIFIAAPLLITLNMRRGAVAGNDEEGGDEASEDASEPAKA